MAAEVRMVNDHLAGHVAGGVLLPGTGLVAEVPNDVAVTLVNHGFAEPVKVAVAEAEASE